ncbi:MAG: hypothetical protein ACI89X_004885 [Planctomycetota bacterium]|jgi:hypothetical protein
MEIDFDAQDAISDFISVPAGTYLCRIAEVRTGTTRAGDDRWSLRLVVAEGQHVGKQAAWDSLVFSIRGRTRARTVLHALGLPSKGRVQLTPTDLEGCTALVEVRPSEYESPSGQVVRRNEVPYDGYRAGSPTDHQASGGDRGDTDAPSTVDASSTSGDGTVDTTQIPF